MGNNAVSSGLGGQLIGGLLGGGGGGMGMGQRRSSSSGFGQKAILGVLGGLAVTALTKYARNKMSGGGTSTPASGGLFSAGVDDTPPNLGYDDQEADSRAEILIRAMVNSAKADGRVDEQEQQNILQRVGNLDREEKEFLRRELSSPLDLQGLIRSVPRGMEREVYAMSLLGITLDEQSEATYLFELAQGLGLDGQACNAMHREMGAPEIFQ